MPAKSGLSHGLAAFVTLMIGAILSKLVHDLLPPLGQLSLLVIGTIQSITGAEIPVNDQFAGAVVVMMVLSFMWGAVYHYGRHS